MYQRGKMTLGSRAASIVAVIVVMLVVFLMVAFFNRIKPLAQMGMDGPNLVAAASLARKVFDQNSSSIGPAWSGAMLPARRLRPGKASWFVL